MTVILRNKDFWSGAMLVAIGALAMAIARNYPLGATLRMGPGYVPNLLGGLLVLGGLSLLIKGLRSNNPIPGGWSLRGLILLPLSLALFGFLMDRAGFVPALLVLIFGSAAAGRDFRFLEVLLFAIALVILSIAVFVWGLGLPYPLIADF